MKPYTTLAPHYDFLLSHVDYVTWYKYIKSIMYQYTANPKTVLEIGTGTGKFGAKFSNDGISIIGVDRSLDMLMEAQKRTFENFKVFCADITTLKLKKKFDFIFAVHDTMNYITNNKDLEKAFQNIHSFMHKDSIFMFDTTSEYNILQNFKNKTSRYNHKGTKIIWSNTYNHKKKIITSTLDFIFLNGEKHSESHEQKIYKVSDIKKLLKKCGFEILDIFGDYGFRPFDEKTIMVNFITRKKQ